MPSINALAGASLTPGGVASGLSDLVSALTQAPVQRQQIEMQRAAQLAQQQNMQDQMGLQRGSAMHQQEMDAENMDLDRQKAGDLNNRSILDYYGHMDPDAAAAARSLMPHQPTWFDAYDHIPASIDQTNPDPNGRILTPTIKTPVAPQDRISQANQAYQAALAASAAAPAAPGFIPTHVMQGHATPSPGALQVINALQHANPGMAASAIPQAAPTASGPPAPVSISEAATAASTNQAPPTPAGATNAAPPQAGPPSPGGKTISQSQIQAKLKPGWDLQKAIAYYQSQGYTVQ